MFTAALWLDELERVEGINEQLGEVNAAWRTAYAVNKPDELVRSEREIRQRMKLNVVDHGPVDPQTVERVLAMRAKAERIARRKRKG